MEKIIKNALDFTEDYFESFCCGHDFEHVERVFNNAKTIIENEDFVEKIDTEAVLLASILHDVDDTKLVKNSGSTKNFLQAQNISEEKIDKILDIISTVGMNEYLRNNRPKTTEAKIVFDADKLDQIGAVAIARSFAYGANHGRKIFDRTQLPTEHYDGKYPNGYASSLNYILEVLINVKSMLHTKTAQKIAQKRHDFMVDYLKEFFEEENDKVWSDYFFSKTRY